MLSCRLIRTQEGPGYRRGVCTGRRRSGSRIGCHCNADCCTNTSRLRLGHASVFCSNVPDGGGPTSSTRSPDRVYHNVFWFGFCGVGSYDVTPESRLIINSCAWISVGTYYATDLTLSWRLPLSLACVGPLSLLSGLPFVPGKFSLQPCLTKSY